MNIQETTDLPFDVNSARATLLTDLRIKVNRAFNNPDEIKYISERQDTVEDEERSSRLASLVASVMGSPHNPDPILELAEFPLRASEVAVCNPYDYKDLIELSYQRVYGSSWKNNSFLREDAKSSLQHEYEHAVPGLGIPGINFRYVVKFLKDSSLRGYGLRASLHFFGEIPLSVYKAILFNPTSDDSSTDLIQQRSFYGREE